MDYKEQTPILEGLFDKYKGRIYMEYERTSVEKSKLVCVFQQDWDDLIVEILATLPSEKEIVMKAWEEYAGECYHSGCNDYSESFPDWWLDQEQENES